MDDEPGNGKTNTALKNALIHQNTIRSWEELEEEFGSEKDESCPTCGSDDLERQPITGWILCQDCFGRFTRGQVRNG